MIQSKLRYRVLLVVGLTLTLVFAAVAMFYAKSQEQAILIDYQRALHKVTNSVVKGLESVMTENHAEIMRDYVEGLKAQRGVTEFVILRKDGSEAFKDNAGIDAVNQKLGTAPFAQHANPQRVLNRDPIKPLFQGVLKDGSDGSYEWTDSSGQQQLVFMDAIQGSAVCARCHEDGESVRGVIKLVAPMTHIKAAILKVRTQSIIVIGGALVLTMLLTGYVLGRSVVNPIEDVTKAMSRISSGDFQSTVPLRGGGEIRRMAASFNHMNTSLNLGYDLLLRERDKLTTIIESAREAIVVTDGKGEIVLINSAATEVLGKSDADVRDAGFSNLLGDPALMQQLTQGDGPEGHTATVHYGTRKLFVSVASIDDGQGQLIGSAAMIRDVTDEHSMMDELKRISITDALTDVFNRRYIDAEMIREMDRARRNEKPLSVLLLDIDFFKKFNDTHGHDQGDRVLQAVGAAMKAIIRQYDSPCRYGGEEFVMILPETDIAGAAIVGERLRKTIEAMEVDGLKVTISLGAATYPHVAVSKPEQLLEAAEAALYKSKESGRNRLRAESMTT